MNEVSTPLELRSQKGTLFFCLPKKGSPKIRQLQRLDPSHCDPSRAGTWQKLELLSASPESCGQNQSLLLHSREGVPVLFNSLHVDFSPTQN